MASFRFRAQAALELRRREHEVAQRDLAIAEDRRERARAQLAAADTARAEARRAGDDLMRQAAPWAQQQWHQTWIVRLDKERAALAAALDRCVEAAAKARAASLRARQRRESLERFRDKAFTAHLAAEAAEERKVLDELGARRAAASSIRREGAPS